MSVRIAVLVTDILLDRPPDLHVRLSYVFRAAA